MSGNRIFLNTINRITKFSVIYLPQFSNSGVVGLFLLSPFISFPYIAYRSFKGNKICQLLFSIFIGLLSICFVPPRADLYRHYLEYNVICQGGFQSMMDNLRFDFILPFLEYVVSRMGLDFEIIRILTISISYILFFNIYNLIKTGNNKTNFTIFIYCILSVPFMDLTLGIRYGLAICLISYVAIKRFITRRNLSVCDYLVLCLGPCTHFSTIWFSFIVLIQPVLPKYIPKLVLLGLFAIAYICANQFDSLLKLLAFDNATTQLINHYGVDGTYGQRYIFHNIIGSIPEYYSIFLAYLVILIFILSIPYNKNTSIPWMVIIIWAFTHSLYTISGRIECIIITLCPIYIYSLSRFKYLFIKFFILGAILVSIINWRAWTVSYPLYILFSPLLILSVGYDQDWLSTFVDQTGTLKIYKR